MLRGSTYVERWTADLSKASARVKYDPVVRLFATALRRVKISIVWFRPSPCQAKHVVLGDAVPPGAQHHYPAGVAGWCLYRQFGTGLVELAVSLAQK